MSDETELTREELEAMMERGESAALLPCAPALADTLVAIYERMGNEAHNCSGICARCSLRPWIAKIRAARAATGGDPE